MFDNQNDRKQLLGTGWFGARGARFQKDLLECAIKKTFETDETLYHCGDSANGIYAVLDGAVQITAPADDGQDFVIHRQGGGFWIGDLALFADAQRLVSVMATQKTRAFFFQAPGWTGWCATRPNMSGTFMLCRMKTCKQPCVSWPILRSPERKKDWCYVCFIWMRGHPSRTVGSPFHRMNWPRWWPCRSRRCIATCTVWRIWV